MNEQLLLEIAESRPENLLFASSDALVALARDRDMSPDIRRAVIAELLVRWCLSKAKEDSMGLEPLLGKAWRPFVDWFRFCRPCAKARALPESADAWPEPTGLHGLVAVLRRRLARLFSAAGFIPVCRGNDAWFVPFQLTADARGAYWSDGEGIAAWRDPVCRALVGTDFAGIRLQMRNGPELKGGVKGSSLILPVRMAALRGRENGLPEYDVLQVLATGSFDGSFHLEDVELRPKFEAMKSQGLDAFMIGPDVPGVISDGERGFCRLDGGMDEQGVMKAIRYHLERTEGCLHMSRDYVLRRLPDMMTHVDRENHHRWNEVAAQLEQMKEAVTRRRNPGEWLEFMSLLATALCHAGRTDDSRKCTYEALEFAKRNGFAAKALRLQVMAAVNAQDMGEVEEYRTLAAGLEEELKSFSGPERDDLLMRFHGTAAQMHAFGVVHGIDGFSGSAAVCHAEKAIDAAEAIANAADPDAKDEAESNVAQDLNYRHLLFALFDPGSGDERSAFDEASEQLNNISSANSVRNNRYHQMRQKSLAYFNAWRNGAAVPGSSERAAVRLPAPPEAEGWLVAANRRHLGALAAAADDADEAAKCFAEGDKALPLDACWAPVLGSTRLASLVQASCSLTACGKKDEAGMYAKAAEETYLRFGQSKLFGVIHAEKWMEALRASADPRALPAFYY